MELSNFDVIKSPVVTRKSIELFKKLGQLTFEVAISANKSVVTRAIEVNFSVKVQKVRIILSKGKNKYFARRKFCCSDKKKAIVTLKDGYKIEIPGMSDFSVVSSENTSSLPKKISS